MEELALSQTTLLELAFVQTWEDRRYPEPVNFRLVTVARLLDKALRDYEDARLALLEHDSMWDGTPPAVRPRRRGQPVTIALFRAVGHLEDLVGSLDRIYRILPALTKSPELASLDDATLADGASERLRHVRNRIWHADEDIAKGRPGTIATLQTDSRGVEIASHRLEFHELVQWLQSSHAFVRKAVASR